LEMLGFLYFENIDLPLNLARQKRLIGSLRE
jgi:hypothetical protein